MSRIGPYFNMHEPRTNPEFLLTLTSTSKYNIFPTHAISNMSNHDFDPMQLNESQQLALGTYTSVTNQEPSAAVLLLQRSEWNVQVHHALSII